MPAIVGGRDTGRCCPDDTDATRSEAAMTSLRIGISLKSFQVFRGIDIDRSRALDLDRQYSVTGLDQATCPSIAAERHQMIVGLLIEENGMAGFTVAIPRDDDRRPRLVPELHHLHDETAIDPGFIAEGDHHG